jgi:hypothetical protein
LHVFDDSYNRLFLPGLKSGGPWTEPKELIRRCSYSWASRLMLRAI